MKKLLFFLTLFYISSAAFAQSPTIDVTNTSPCGTVNVIFLAGPAGAGCDDWVPSVEMLVPPGTTTFTVAGLTWYTPNPAAMTGCFFHSAWVTNVSGNEYFVSTCGPDRVTPPNVCAVAITYVPDPLGLLDQILIQ